MRPARLPAAALFLAATLTPLSALTLKIATLAPEGSPWVVGLRRTAGEWERISGGQVSLKIYAGGIAGEELGLLEPDILAISVPFLVRDEGELDYLLAAARTRYAEPFARRGYLLAALPKAGWVHFFAREPVARPADLRRLKLAVPGDDPLFVEIWRRMGFNAFSLSLNDLLMGLQAGLADACYAPLLAAASFQWFGSARYMPELPVAPVLGGILLSERALEQVPAELRPALLAAFAELESSLNRQMMSLETEALAAMRRHGLEVVPVPPEAAAEWRDLASSGSSLVIGKSFSQESFEWVRGTLEAYRRR
jgi:TRAP-type C4-dicarboxylate transport system substrate-binding protein